MASAVEVEFIFVVGHRVMVIEDKVGQLNPRSPARSVLEPLVGKMLTVEAVEEIERANCPHCQNRIGHAQLLTVSHESGKYSGISGDWFMVHS